MNDIAQRAGLDDADLVWFQTTDPFRKFFHGETAPIPDSLVVAYSNGRDEVRQRHKGGFDVPREAESADFAALIVDARVAWRSGTWRGSLSTHGRRSVRTEAISARAGDLLLRAGGRNGNAPLYGLAAAVCFTDRDARPGEQRGARRILLPRGVRRQEAWCRGLA